MNPNPDDKLPLRPIWHRGIVIGAGAAAVVIFSLWWIGRASNDLALARKLAVRGQKLYLEGQYADALPLFERAVRHRPDDIVAQRGLVETELKLRKFDDALRDADAAIIRFPADWHLVEARADALVSLDRLSDAIQSYTRCIELGPSGYWEPWIKLAAAYQGIGSIEEARATYRDLLNRYPGHEVAKKRLHMLEK